MQEKNYSKRELDHYIGDIRETLSEQDDVLALQNKLLEKIYQQTTATNGRVNKLEWWQKAVIWGLGAVWTFMLAVIPIIYRAYQNALENKVTLIAETKWENFIRGSIRQ